MSSKTKIKDLPQVPAQDIDPLELVERLRLFPNPAMLPKDEQDPQNQILLDPPCGVATDVKDSYESFRRDFIADQMTENPEEESLSCIMPDPKKTGMFLLSIVQLAEQHQCEDPEKWLTSSSTFYKNEIEDELRNLEDKYPDVHIEPSDFDIICDFLVGNSLIATSWTTLRITRVLADKIHEAYGCLVRWFSMSNA